MPHRIEQIYGPVVFAHRGASVHAPENTMAAFQLAIDQGADGIELDAKLTSDGQIVVIHDQTVNRTTGRPGVVRKMTLAQLKELDAGCFFNASFAGEPIPTLAEVFALAGGRIIINVEITNYTSVWDALPDKIADLVIETGLQEHILFSSFHPVSLIRIKRRLPECPVALLTLPGPAGRLMSGGLGRRLAPEYLHPFYTHVSESSLQREHQHGRRVNAWTVNDPAEIARLYKMGIDGIITDDPLLTKQPLLAKQVTEEK